MEAAAWQKAVRPVCRCGHSSTFNPHGLWWYFERKGWDSNFYCARERFACRECRKAGRPRQRPVRIETAAMTGGEYAFPLPDERIWKRAISRFR
jgi:hypothetical protein